MTAAALVEAVAKCYGMKVSEDEASYLVWNHTGYPSFWMTDRPIEELRHQIAAYLQGKRYCPRCGVQFDHLNRTTFGVCRKCAREMDW